MARLSGLKLTKQMKIIHQIDPRNLRNGTTIDPSKFRFQMYMCLTYLYFIWVLLILPFYISFWESPYNFDSMDMIYSIANIFLVFDIIISFFVGYRLEGTMVTSFKKTSHFYLHSYFFWDLLAALPFNLIPQGGPIVLRRLLVGNKYIKLLTIMRQSKEIHYQERFKLWYSIR